MVVCVRGPKRSVNFEVVFQVKCLLEEVFEVLRGLVMEIGSHFFVSLFDFQEHLIVVNPCIHESGSELVLLFSELN